MEVGGVETVVEEKDNGLPNRFATCQTINLISLGGFVELSGPIDFS